MRDPDFIIIGAQKSGTTWLVDMLQEHQDIYIDREEIHYFDTNYDKGVEWYLSHFGNAGECKIVGEKTPDYFGLSSSVSSLINKDLPSVKLILILRDPIERAISAYNHYVRTTFLSPLNDIDEYFTQALNGNDYLNIINYSRYKTRLEDFTKKFGENRLLVLSYEDMVSKKRFTLNKVESFLKVTPKVNYNFSKKSNAFNKSFIGLLISYYFPRLNKIGWQFDKIFKNYKQKPTQEILNSLKLELAESIEVHKQLKKYD